MMSSRSLIALLSIALSHTGDPPSIRRRPTVCMRLFIIGTLDVEGELPVTPLLLVLTVGYECLGQTKKLFCSAD